MLCAFRSSKLAISSKAFLSLHPESSIEDFKRFCNDCHFTIIDVPTSIPIHRRKHGKNVVPGRHSNQR